jgi:signal recognition particle GTPase
VPTDEEAIEVLQDLVASMLGSSDRPLKYAQDGVTVWLFVGVNGVGKTTSVGKLAYQLTKQGHKPLLAACDTFRAAAIEQLQEWGPPRQLSGYRRTAGRRSRSGCFRCHRRREESWPRCSSYRHSWTAAHQIELDE